MCVCVLCLCCSYDCLIPSFPPYQEWSTLYRLHIRCLRRALRAAYLLAAFPLCKIVVQASLRLTVHLSTYIHRVLVGNGAHLWARQHQIATCPPDDLITGKTDFLNSLFTHFFCCCLRSSQSSVFGSHDPPGGRNTGYCHDQWLHI